MTNCTSLYDDFTADLTVAKLCDRLGHEIDGNETAHAIVGEHIKHRDSFDGIDSVHVVRENGRLLGVLDYCDLLEWTFEYYQQHRTSDDIPAHELGLEPFLEHRTDPYDGRFARDFAKPIAPTRMVSSKTPFSQAVHFFAEDESPYFVSDADQIIGIFRPADIYRPRGLFCFLALVLDLETAALNLCTWFQDALRSLPGERRSKAIKSCLAKFRKFREDEWTYSDSGEDFAQVMAWFDRDVIQATTFIDKATMIKKSKLLIDQSNSRIDRIFARAERVRNACAHPLATDEGHSERWSIASQDLFEMTPAETSQFVKDCQEVIASIKTVMPKNS